MNFTDIIGHDYIKNQIKKSIENNSFSHAHLIVGDDGIGKSLIAKQAAFMILKKSKNIEYADILNFKSEKASIGVDVIRSFIEEMNKKPYEGDKKVIIVHGAQSMTVQAQNAFLKTIEEPPKGVYIFLLCENLEIMLDTIKSRCQIHKLRPLRPIEMDIFISKNYPDIKEDERKPIIAFSDGIPGRVEKFMLDKTFSIIRDIAIDILVSCGEINTKELLKYSEELNKHKKIWRELLTTFVSYIRDAILYKETGDKELIINIDKMNEINKLINKYSYNKLNKFIDIIDYVKDNLYSNVNAVITFDIMLLKFQEVQ